MKHYFDSIKISIILLSVRASKIILYYFDLYKGLFFIFGRIKTKK